MITVTINGKEKQYEKGVTYESIADDYQEEYGGLIAAVIANKKARELVRTAEQDCEVRFILTTDLAGHRAYVRTATMLLFKALTDVAGQEAANQAKLECLIGHGHYCSVGDDLVLNQELLERLQNRMKELVDLNLPIEKRSHSLPEAIDLFRQKGMSGKEKLLNYRRSSFVNIYHLEDYCDYYYGFMLPRTGYVKQFQLTLYEEGLMLHVPRRKEPGMIPKFEERKKLFLTLKEAQQWGRDLGIDTVGDLNDQICEGKISEILLVQEALQERRIGEIAKEIADRDGVKFVMIAGPSSSGKTTFSHRLSVQLRTHGMTPHPIGLDDYFRNREDTPKDENGDYNFECLEAIDVEQFNKDMGRLLAGERVELPSFNFKTGSREFNGRFKQLKEEDVLVIEGIHGLNDKMSHSLPNASKYRIYISALTSLNIDEHNRIATTDGRLVRRMVRDARTRGASAKRTIEMWPSVRRGEEDNIFPFQESADTFFNSALIYELAVLKQFAEPLLFGIKQDEAEYHEAQRLLKFLEYFLGVSSEEVPNNSIIREFVGGSCFKV